MYAYCIVQLFIGLFPAHVACICGSTAILLHASLCSIKKPLLSETGNRKRTTAEIRMVLEASAGKLHVTSSHISLVKKKKKKSRIVQPAVISLGWLGRVHSSPAGQVYNLPDNG